MAWKDIKTLAASVNSGKIDAKSLVDQALKNIQESNDFKAVISVLKDNAYKRADQIDDKIKKGVNAGKLAGVPFIAKDNFLVFGGSTTAASNMLRDFVAPYQSTAINRLEAEGAICVAKANLDAFAHGSSTENSDFMTTKNPYDKTRVPGGSSGGSTTVVALHMVPFSVGTDTGGSIRMPASFCGVVGFKPTYGLVSRSGVVAMASSTDTIGPIASSVQDAALVLEVMSGKDELDSTTIDLQEKAISSLDTKLNRPKIGIIKEYLEQGLSPEVKNNLEKVIKFLSDSGAEIKKVSIPSLPLSLAVYYVLCPAEVSSNLSRYDGQKYGFHDKNASNLEDSYKKSRSNGFGKEAKRRIMIGTYVLSSGYYDAYYKKAQIIRTKIINEFNEAFKSYDFLIGPTTATTAFKIGEHSNDPLAMYLTDIMTVAVNLVGIPAISLPTGFDSNNLPLAIQLMAPQSEDKKLLGYAKQVEELIKS
jgi:aspartyl-tRNA(Asn)/glutamyl-tRNA(Gln) amidotransferase subunit A